MTSARYKRIPASDLRPGNAVLFLGTEHVIAEIEPYTHPTIGATAGTARAADGWGITLFPGSYIEVVA